MTVAQPTPLSRSFTQETDSAATAGPTVFASASLGTPAPPSALLPSDLISARTHRRTATAAGNAPSAVDYGLGPGGAPRLSARRANTPPRVPWPRPTPPTAATPAPAASPVHTVPIPSDRDRTELYETVPLRLPFTPGDTPTVLKNVHALGDDDELQNCSCELSQLPRRAIFACQLGSRASG